MALTNIQNYTKNYKKMYPESVLSEYMVRRILYGDGIPYVRTGNKRLFQEEHMNQYLNGKRWPAETIEACKRS